VGFGRDKGKGRDLTLEGVAGREECWRQRRGKERIRVDIVDLKSGWATHAGCLKIEIGSKKVSTVSFGSR